MDFLNKYSYAPSSEKTASLIEKVKAAVSLDGANEALKLCFAAMDLTTLRTNDTASYVKSFVEKANGIAENFEGYPFPASICVYPNFAALVRETRASEELHVTTVASCFPSAQSFLPVKVLECVNAVEQGADEIDIVLALNSFLDGDYEAAAAEIKAMRAAIDEAASKLGRKVVLKVIIETGLLVTPENIANASFLSMEAGADFIKTSTGKVDVNATPEAAVVMCECIKAYYEKTGVMVGFKAAGGVSSAEDALLYHDIVKAILGEKWLDKEYFRLGVSRLGNNLISAIEQKTVKYF